MKAILEPILLGQKQSITGFRYAKENFETPWHFHPQYELTYIEQSVGTKFVGDYVGPYEPGELVLLRSNLPHCWKNHIGYGGLSKSVVVQWNKGIFPKVPELAAVFGMFKKASRGIIFDRAESASCVAQLLSFPELEGHDLYIALLRVLVKLTKCRGGILSKTNFVDDIPSEYGSRMANTYDFVSNHFDRKISLLELAALTNMSEQSFSRFFTKMLGRPFFTFLNEYRINRAARMLLDSDHSVSQIGYACGYESLSFYHRQFKKFMGCSPRVYQKKFKNR